MEDGSAITAESVNEMVRGLFPGSVNWCAEVGTTHAVARAMSRGLIVV